MAKKKSPLKRVAKKATKKATKKSEKKVEEKKPITLTDKKVIEPKKPETPQPVRPLSYNINTASLDMMKNTVHAVVGILTDNKQPSTAKILADGWNIFEQQISS